VIALIDYGAGNLDSVRRAFRAVGVETRTFKNALDLDEADAIVVPGVGHFQATSTIDEAWRDAFIRHVYNGRPLLGICLGMQWLFEGSEEAPGCPGLGLIEGACARLRPEGLKVPHVGWNQLEPVRASALLEGLSETAYAYFTHTYAAPVTADCVATTSHGARFAAAVERGMVWGTQFHPEKSGDAGLQILRNFVRLAEGRS
jgi:imidazole glycerol-phosphate synthase subunit HisH